MFIDQDIAHVHLHSALYANSLMSSEWAQWVVFTIPIQLTLNLTGKIMLSLPPILQTLLLNFHGSILVICFSPEIDH